MIYKLPDRATTNLREAISCAFASGVNAHCHRADYQLAANFWTPTSLARTVGLAEHECRMVKRGEPQITGFAYTTRRIYLVMVARIGSYEHIARLLHVCALVSDDPDYVEHRYKRVSMLILCDDCPPAALDFARRHHVRVIAQGAQRPTQIVTRTVTSSDARDRSMRCAETLLSVID